jgi:hypothetical protein
MDLCQRLRRAGWEVLYMPCLTALRHRQAWRTLPRSQERRQHDRPDRRPGSDQRSQSHPERHRHTADHPPGATVNLRLTRLRGSLPRGRYRVGVRLTQAGQRASGLRRGIRLH